MRHIMLIVHEILESEIIMMEYFKDRLKDNVSYRSTKYHYHVDFISMFETNVLRNHCSQTLCKRYYFN